MSHGTETPVEMVEDLDDDDEDDKQEEDNVSTLLDPGVAVRESCRKFGEKMSPTQKENGQKNTKKSSE